MRKRTYLFPLSRRIIYGHGSVSIRNTYACTRMVKYGKRTRRKYFLCFSTGWESIEKLCKFHSCYRIIRSLLTQRVLLQFSNESVTNNLRRRVNESRFSKQRCLRAVYAMKWKIESKRCYDTFWFLQEFDTSCFEEMKKIFKLVGNNLFVKAQICIKIHGHTYTYDNFR